MENCLDLTIAIPGSSSSPSIPSSGENGGMKELDINQLPSYEEEEEEESPNNGGPAPRKKLRLTKEQSRLLEESFRQNQTLNLIQKEILAEQLHLKQRQVEVWFQNRRARSKLKQTEMECEYLKRWFGSLTEQNKKLQKEVDELRTVDTGHHRRLLPPPASTLTMCPRCQRVTTTTTNPNMPFLLQSSAACYN